MKETQRKRGFAKVMALLLTFMLILGMMPAMAFATPLTSGLGSVRVIVENSTFSEGEGAPWDGTLIDTKVELAENSTMMGCVASALENKGYTQEGAKNNYISQINGLSEFDGGIMSGWMGTLNDWFTNLGFEAFTVSNGTLSDGDIIHIQYTCAYGADLGGSWDDNDTSLKALEIEGGKLEPDFNPECLSYDVNLNSGSKSITITPTAANKNFLVKTFKNEMVDDETEGESFYKRGMEIPVEIGDFIYVGCGISGWPTMNSGAGGTWYVLKIVSDENSSNTEKIADVISKINQLGEIESLSIENYSDYMSSVTSARNAYNSLSSEEKNSVTNYNKLSSLENALKDCQKTIAFIENLNKIQSVQNIGIDNITDAEEVIKEYDKLTSANLKFLSNEEKAKVLAIRNKTEKIKLVNKNYEESLEKALTYITTSVTDPKVGPISGEWAVLSLNRGNTVTPSWNQKYINNLSKHVDEKNGILHAKKYTEYSRVVLALTSLGIDATSFATDEKVYDLVEPLLSKQDNGKYWASWQGNNGTAFALLALNSGNYKNNDAGNKARADFIDALLDVQMESGAWSINANMSADLDMTSMIIQALAPYYSTNENVKTSIDKGLSWLSEQFQDKEGDYGSSEALAQLIVALSTLGIDADNDQRFIYDGVSALDRFLSYEVETGGFKHVNKASDGYQPVVNQMATEQACYALVAYNRFKNGNNPLYNMSDVSKEITNMIKTAKVLISQNEYSYAQSIANTEEGIKQEIEKTISKFGLTGLDIAVSIDTFTAAKSGTANAVSGENGEFTGTVSVSKNVREQTDQLNTEKITINGTIKASTYVKAEDKKELYVYFTLLGDAVHGEPTGTTGTHTLRGNNLVTWIPRTKVLIDENSNVKYVFDKMLRENGMTCSNPSGNYVESITRNGVTIGEFTNGKLSGWMYTINGTHPMFGLNEQRVYNGDDIVWHYTDDYTKEEGSEKWNTPEETKNAGAGVSSNDNKTSTKLDVSVSGNTATASIKSDVASEIVKQAKENKAKEVVLEVALSDTKAADTIKLELPNNVLSSVANDTTADLTIKTSQGEVTLDNDTLKQISKDAKGANVSLEISKADKPTDAQKKLAGENAQVYELNVKSGANSISQFAGKVKVRIEIPASLKGKNVMVIHFDGAEKISKMPGEKLMVSGKEYYEFITTHFSEFALVDADEVKLDEEEKTLDVAGVKAILKDVKLSAKSIKTANKAIKVTVSRSEETVAAIKELKEAGYSVKYKFYRSTKKASKYELKKTTTKTSYTNTSGKKGTKYYYKVRLAVYDKDGKLVAQSTLKQCKYAARKWTK